MNIFNANDDFYPTPVGLLNKITEGLKWDDFSSILEPEAGKGDIAEFVMEKCSTYRYRDEIDVDCIEIDSELRNVLKGKNFRVVHDDFLTFSTFKKYDLIFMNPPFSSGSAHLLKALELQSDGGSIICILNAETIRNPYTNERKVLVQKLTDLNADISFMQNEFSDAEHQTDVEIAVIKVYIPEKQYESRIYEELKQRNYQENTYDTITDLAPNDFIKAIVQLYNMEVECGVRLIQEYKAMSPHIMSDFEHNSYAEPILKMEINGKHDLSTNKYVKRVRSKYWRALFSDKRFTGNMTSNLSKQYHEQVSELSNYDFSEYNIKCIQLEMSKSLIKGIEDCIIELFDKLSHQYSYSDELSANIHYYNGWKTNKAWIINKKVILPYMNAFSSWSGKFDPDYRIRNQLMDIEKALNYLDGGLTECRDMDLWLNHAAKTGQTKKIPLKYFTVTFYKKGTCHIEFTNLELLKKLNIFGAQNKRWLPPAYGKKTYQDMSADEQAVIDEFEGKESYQKVLEKADYFIYKPENAANLLDTNNVSA